MHYYFLLNCKTWDCSIKKHDGLLEVDNYYDVYGPYKSFSIAKNQAHIILVNIKNKIIRANKILRESKRSDAE